MKTHTFQTSNPKVCPVFDLLKKGMKTIEGRPYSKKYHNIQKGDTIILKHNGSSFNARVKSVKRYKTLQGYLRNEGLKRTLPGIRDMDKAKQIYNKWSSPRRRQQLREKYGYAMLAIRV
jgi:ASC-1-like (ASCH) protein